LLSTNKIFLARDQYVKHYPFTGYLVGKVTFVKNIDSDNSMKLPQGALSAPDAVAAGMSGYNTGDVFSLIYVASSGKVFTFKIRFVDESELNFDDAIVGQLD
jgi:hypothetical protein